MEARVGVHSQRLAVVGVSALWLVPGLASTQPASRIVVDVMVSHISNRTGPFDERASELHRKLRKDFRYESLRVLQTQRLALDLDQVGTLTLPNGRRLRVRPRQVGNRGVLMAVDVEGTLKTDLRVRNGRLVVIGTEPYEDGKLVISLEPHF